MKKHTKEKIIEELQDLLHNNLKKLNKKDIVTLTSLIEEIKAIKPSKNSKNFIDKLLKAFWKVFKE